MLDERCRDHEGRGLIQGKFYHIEDTHPMQGGFYFFTGRIDEKGAYFESQALGVQTFNPSETRNLLVVKEPLTELGIASNQIAREYSWIQSKLETEKKEGKPKEEWVYFP